MSTAVEQEAARQNKNHNEVQASGLLEETIARRRSNRYRDGLQLIARREIIVYYELSGSL